MAKDSEASRVARVAPPVAYAVLIEQGSNNYSTYAPDLPGCFATGETVEEVMRLMREGIPFHLEGLRENGDLVPEPRTRLAMIEVETGDVASGDAVQR